MRLPSAYELDNAPAFERFFLVRADEAFDVAPILDAARALVDAGAGRAPRAAAAPCAFQPGFLGSGEDPMKIRASIALLSFGLSLVAAAPRARAAEPTGSVRLRRFALLVGVNDGGPARARLRYAASDAHAMARVLESLGGVAPGDLVFVADGSRRALQDGFAAVERLLRAEQSRGVRRELVFYYSGHSDEEGLLLGGERISYQELRAFIHEAPADLSLAILDSCESGAFTRHKGGARRAPFLLDASIDTHGHAFLTSSAANEVAQESDRIAASFFTYFLVSGLRGAADSNRDRRVTLQEAFQFASQETLARTERTQGGPQHAAYEFDLTGTGDMVVTDVRTTQSGLVLTPELSGRISVREAGGALIAELRKPAGSSVELGLEAGSYVVAVESGGAVKEAQLTLAAGEHLALGGVAFHPGAPLEVAVARGDDAPAATPSGAPAIAATSAEPAHETTSFKLGFIPRSVDGRTDVVGVSYGFIADRAASLRGVQLSLGYNQIDGVLSRPPAHGRGERRREPDVGGADRGRRQRRRRQRPRRADRRRRQRLRR